MARTVVRATILCILKIRIYLPHYILLLCIACRTGVFFSFRSYKGERAESKASAERESRDAWNAKTDNACSAGYILRIYSIRVCIYYGINKTISLVLTNLQ